MPAEPPAAAAPVAAGGAHTAVVPERRLINDIARQFAHLPAEVAAAAVADHVRRFWDPRMRARLLALADDGGLDPLPAAAAAQLR
ncbi:formate dehydrogenase subunit delta [Cryptosporangium sp. NPDC048952]|uniref:formate dehydrogenase subunit delta n=1 Tax=Cryptosporangium sp. NPDC048952 TaxID=3363961 RepID=UPI0037217AA2